MTLVIIDYLNVDMVKAVEYSHSGLLSCPGQSAAQSFVAHDAHVVSALFLHLSPPQLLRTGLAGLADNLLIQELNALAVIRLRRTV